MQLVTENKIFIITIRVFVLIENLEFYKIIILKMREAETLDSYPIKTK